MNVILVSKMNNKETNKIILNALIEQYGAAIKTLEKIINICPDDFWVDSENGPAFYKVVYHILYFMDLYRSATKEESQSFKPRFDTAEDFGTSKVNFHPSEWSSILSKEEILGYISELKIKEQERFDNLKIDDLTKESIFDWHGSSLLSSILYNLRHIMLHIGALQARLRIHGVEERYWVGKSLIID